jgi:hypothetical protein
MYHKVYQPYTRILSMNLVPHCCHPLLSKYWPCFILQLPSPFWLCCLFCSSSWLISWEEEQEAWQV